MTGRGAGRVAKSLASPQIVRITSNYARLLAGFVLGLLLVRILLYFGEEVYAAVVVFATSVGVSAILKEMVRGSMVPELGLKLHAEDPSAFPEAYASALMLSLFAAVGAVVILLGFAAALGLLNIAPELYSASLFFLGLRTVHTFVAVALAPTVNLMPISGQMAANNAWITAERVGEVGAAALVAAFIPYAVPSDQLWWFGLASFVGMMCATLGAAVYIIRQDPRFVPSLRHANTALMRKIAKTIGWNGFAVVSVNLYFRFDLLLINVLFGTIGTVVFGIASQLATYIRQLTMGFVIGMDSVIAKRAASGEAGKAEILDLTQRTTELFALVSFSGAAFLLMHADQLIAFVFADRLSQPQRDLPLIVTMFQLLTIGIVARALSEGWMALLTGSGRIQDYGPAVFVGALANPPLVLALHYLLPADVRLFGAGYAFIVLTLIMHGLVVPYVTARYLNVTAAALYAPCLRPVVLVAIAVVISLLLESLIAQPWLQVATTAVVMSAIMAWPFLRAVAGLTAFK